MVSFYRNDRKINPQTIAGGRVPVDDTGIECQVGQFDAGQMLIFGQTVCKNEPVFADTFGTPAALTRFRRDSPLLTNSQSTLPGTCLSMFIQVLNIDRSIL